MNKNKSVLPILNVNYHFSNDITQGAKNAYIRLPAENYLEKLDYKVYDTPMQFDCNKLSRFIVKVDGVN